MAINSQSYNSWDLSASASSNRSATLLIACRLVQPVWPRGLGPGHHVIVAPQAPAATQVAAAALVQPHHHVDAALPPPGEVEPAAVIAVGQEHVAGLQSLLQGSQLGVLALLLALVAPQGRVQDRATGQGEDHHQAGDREAQARLLGAR